MVPYKRRMAVSVQQIESLLAGTQCRQCGYPGCTEYAEAIVNQSESTNRCRPGGSRVHILLQQTLHKTAETSLFQSPLPPQTAEVKEEDCIGCTLCLQACPTGAIVGSNKKLHSIVSELCTGCGLCLPPCPVSCITLNPAPPAHKLTQQQPDGSLTEAATQATRNLVTAHRNRRMASQNRQQKQQLSAQPVQLATLAPDVAAKIEAARQKAQQKYAAKGPPKTPKHLKSKE